MTTHALPAHWKKVPTFAKCSVPLYAIPRISRIRWNAPTNNGPWQGMLRRCRMMNSAAAIAGLHTKRICTVKTTACKPPKRVLMAFGRHQDGTTETSELVIGSDGYNSMLCDFYLKIRLSADTDHQE